MTERVFPDWHNIYREQPVETMPWYFDGLDPDLARDLEAIDLHGGRILDLGTGPGTQAIERAARGFTVVATDLAAAAIEVARARAATRGVVVEFRVDDVLDSTLEGRFDAVIDRGCFHTLPPARRGDYVAMVADRLPPGGHLLLKCFSHLQPGDVGPYRFTAAEIEAVFASALELTLLRETVYHGTLDPLPRALSCVLRRRAA